MRTIQIVTYRCCQDVDLHFWFFAINEDMLFLERIKLNEDIAKLERQIAAFERQMNATKQPRRKRELFVELQKLKGGLNG